MRAMYSMSLSRTAKERHWHETIPRADDSVTADAIGGLSVTICIGVFFNCRSYSDKCGYIPRTFSPVINFGDSFPVFPFGK